MLIACTHWLNSFASRCRDGVIAHRSCETLVITSVPQMTGATKIFNTHMAKDRNDAIPGKYYPGTYHLN